MGRDGRRARHSPSDPIRTRLSYAVRRVPAARSQEYFSGLGATAFGLVVLPEAFGPVGETDPSPGTRARLFAAFESSDALALALKRSGEALRLRAAPVEGGAFAWLSGPAGADVPPMRVRACAADELARVVRFGVPLAESAPVHDGLAGALRTALAPLPPSLRAALAPLLASLDPLGGELSCAPARGAAPAGDEATALALGARFAARRAQLAAISAAVTRLELAGAGDGYDAWPGLAAAASGARAAKPGDREAAAEACALLVEARAAMQDELEALRAVR